MRFGMPTYNRDKQVFAFALKKTILAFTQTTMLLGKHKQELGKANFERNCIRYCKLEDINFDELRKVFSESYTSNPYIENSGQNQNIAMTTVLINLVSVSAQGTLLRINTS